MKMLRQQRRLLPITIVVIALLIGVKVTSLAQAAISPAMEATDRPLSSKTSAGLPVAKSGSPVTSEPVPPSMAEIQLLQDLRKRKDSLDRREREIDQRSELLETAEQRMRARLVELDGLQKKLQATNENETNKEKSEVEWTY